jgi:hypothetical protein
MSFGHPLLASWDSFPRDRLKDRGIFYRDLKLSSGKIDPTIPLVVHGGQVSDLQD